MKPAFGNHMSKNKRDGQPSVFHEHGAVLVEIALGLPLFLMLLLISLWIGIALNEASGMKLALRKSVSLAITRGDYVLMGFNSTEPRGTNQERGLIPAIDDYVDGTTGASFLTVKSLFKSANLPDNYPAEQLYRTWLLASYPKATGFRDVPRQALYALAYMYNFMEQIAGSALKYPCDPDIEPTSNGSNSDFAGYNCLKCTLMSLSDMALHGCPGDPSICSPLNDRDIATDRIGLRCVYKPDHGVLRPIHRFMIYFAGGSAGGGTSAVGRMEDAEWRFLRIKEFN